jgi:hypothetical protein
VQGLTNFANQVAIIFAITFPTALYLGALVCFLYGVWALWRQSTPENPWRGRPWVPWVSITMSGACASFYAILNKVDVSAESSVRISATPSITGYTDDITTSNLLGNTPGDAIVNIVDVFALFFQCFGAWACYVAMMGWRSSVNGETNRTILGCGVQFMFGVMLINAHSMAQWLVDVMGLQT